MARRINERLRETLNYIQTYLEAYGYPPTIREIGEAIGVSSTSQVNYYLSKLEQGGYIVRDPEVSRGLRLVAPAKAVLPAVPESRDEPSIVSIPILGTIVASAPVRSDPLPGDETIELTSTLFGRDTSDLFCLRVRGDSMIDALIHDGDLVVLRRQSEVNNGDMAAVWLTDREETTLKKVYYEGRQVRLQPANPQYDPIYVPAAAVQIQGKALLVIRRAG